jgi:ComF family protein
MPSFISQVLDIIFPKKDEVTELEALANTGRLGTITPSFDTPKPWMRALFHYKDKTARVLVLEIKYSRNKILLDAVAGLLYEDIISLAEDYGPFDTTSWTLISIPTGSAHTREKGFNQADDLARAIVKLGADANLDYIENGLRKIKETEAQVKVNNRHARLNNLHNSFLASEKVAGKNIIIIDDVITTGATMIEARRALKEASAGKIIALAIAH